MITKLLYVQPSELKFPCSQAQLNKLSACWLQLTNRTDHNVAFKVKTTHPRKYCVRPNVGIVSPGSTRVVRVSMQVQKESIAAGVPKDKFLIQSMIAPVGLSAEDITSEMFRKERGNGLEEHMLRVAFVTADPPSPIPEGSEEECSPEAYEQEKAKHERRLSKLFDSSCETPLSSELCTSMKEEDFQDQCSEVSTSTEVSEDQFLEESAYVSESKNQSSHSQGFHELNFCLPGSVRSFSMFQDWDLVSKSVEERSLAAIENQELQHKLGMARKQINKRSHNSALSVFMLLVACFVGFVFGYAFK